MVTALHDIVDSYMPLVETLGRQDRLILMERLSRSLQSEEQTKRPLSSFYGAFDSVKDSEEIIAEIRSSRNNSRERESL